VLLKLAAVTVGANTPRRPTPAAAHATSLTPENAALPVMSTGWSQAVAQAGLLWRSRMSPQRGSQPFVSSVGVPAFSSTAP
jgi:hypothetical protein